ncbi:MAG: sulfurtransferase-like selenium metabolism protein YedF [Desulfomonilaceae bacterium]
MVERLRIDARGLACPQPVLRTKEVLDKGEPAEFVVLVDNQAAKENVCRFAASQGCTVQASGLGQDHFEIIVCRGEAETGASQPQPTAAPIVCTSSGFGQIVVYVGTSCMGKGDDELGRKLMRGFLRTWIDADSKPWRMIFVNSGVELTTIDDEAVDALAMLQEKGVEILSCGTCLQHFGYEDKLKVGRSTNMYEVVDTLKEAYKVISPD